MSDRPTVYPVGESDRGRRLDQFLHERVPALSRSSIQRAIRSRVSLSWGVQPRPSTRVRAGGCVLVAFPPVAETPLPIRIPILARGEGWLAVDKPSGIPVHPVNSVRENSLIRLLGRQLGRTGLRLAHRLDRETSGVLLVAESAEAARHLSAEFRAGRVGKEYLALVRGVMEGEAGAIGLPIAEARNSKVFVRREAGPEGQSALTRWRVEERFPDRTLLRLYPLTGRRHQLRVHLAHIGHPILGDLLYGRGDDAYLERLREGSDRRVAEGGPKRQLLHCARLTFSSPQGTDVVVEAPPPEDFREFLATYS